MSEKKQVISGVKWTTVSTITYAVVGLLKISTLSRILDKSDFGLMALVMFVLGFMNIFMDMGLTSAILHKQGISKNEYSSLYWLNIVFSLFLFSIIYILSPLIAQFYEQEELITLIPLMALSLIISSIGKQFRIILQKDLKFKTISIVDIISYVSSLSLAIFLAINNYGVYSLIYSALFQYLISNIIFLIYGLQDEGLNFYFSYKETKPFLRIGIYQVGSQIVNYFNRDLDTLIIGKLFGMEILGGYNLAKQLVFRPAQIINPILTRVASPLLAKFQGDLTKLKDNYLKLVNIVVSINLPIYLGLIAFAPLVVRVFYGEGFESITLLVRILSVYMIFRAIGNPIGSLVIATGKTHLEFVWNLFTLLIMPIFIYIGAQYSIEYVAIAIVMAMVVLFIPNWWYLPRQMIQVSLTEYIKNLMPKFKEIYFLLLVKNKNR